MSRLLLDTHVFIWTAADPGRIGEAARAAIADGANDVFVSAASIWEIAIKARLGKITTPPGVVDMVAEKGFDPLPISLAHAERAGDLPVHHRDPFDRMLIAQATDEGLTIVTHDESFEAYDVRLMPV